MKLEIETNYIDDQIQWLTVVWIQFGDGYPKVLSVGSGATRAESRKDARL